MTVMTFNLRTIAKVDEENIWHNRVERAAKAVLKHDPLIVGTQEGHLSMLQDLEPHLTSYAWLGEGREEGRTGEHCAIFYKKDDLSVVEQGQFWLSEQPDVPGSKGWDTMCPRVCTWARFRWNNGAGREFIHFNTHLDHKGKEARVRGISLICHAIKEQRAANGLPIVLTGDFNSVPASDVIKFMRGEIELEGERIEMTDAFSVASEPIQKTAHGFRGEVEGNPIDYIFVTPGIDVLEVLVDREQIDGGYPSDHYPVTAQINLPE